MKGQNLTWIALIIMLLAMLLLVMVFFPKIYEMSPKVLEGIGGM